MATSTLPLRANVTFGNALRAEWIKFRTLRSTYWAAGVAVLFTVLFSSGLILAISVAPAEEGMDPRAVILDQLGEDPSISTLGFGYSFAQYVVAVLGVLIISAERGPGLLNMTLAAVPQRTPVYTAKLVLSFATGFLLGLVSSLLSFFSAQPVLGRFGLGAGIGEGRVLQVILGGSLYLGLIAVLSTAVGSMFRSTASGAGVMLGLILFAPGLVNMIPVIGGFLNQILPTSAGTMLYQPADLVGWSTVLTGLLILVGWAALAAIAAGVMFKRRDVS
jgi:ABC-2 type transport system permease protein